MLSRLQMMHLSFLLLLVIVVSVNSDISFRKYCKQDVNPDVLPSTGTSSAGFLSLSDNEIYDPGMDCNLTLTAEIGFSIMVSFINVSLRNSSFDTLLVLYNDYTKQALLAGDRTCNNESCYGLVFESGRYSPNITFHFMSSKVPVPQNLTGFNALYTVFDTADSKSGQCLGKNRFLCVNSHCIANDLVCDKHNNCGDGSDETQCEVSMLNTTWGIIVIAIAVISTLLFVPMFCYLAARGTGNVIKSTTLPNQPTPLYSTVNNNEGTNLLTSSGGPSASYWGSSGEIHPRFYSFPISADGEPSTSSEHQVSHSYQGVTHMPS